MRRSHLVSLILIVLVTAGVLSWVLVRGWAPVLGVQLQGGVEVVLRPTDEAADDQLDRSIEIIRSRVDALGVAEPDITRQGQQVVVQLPGVRDRQRAVELVGQTAELRFRPVAEQFNPGDQEALTRASDLVAELNGEPTSSGQVITADTTEIQAPIFGFTPPALDTPERAVLLPGRFGAGYALLPAEMTGEGVADAYSTFTHEWQVNVEFTEEGADQFDDIAARWVGNQLGMVLDGRVESAPTLNVAEFGGTAVISGGFTPEAAEDLATVLRFGALPIEFIQDDVRTVSATLGEGTLRAGVVAGLVGLALVGLYMIFYYRLLGFVAVCSLAISGGLLWSLISWLGESRGLALTLAGTTGIVVSIGVQVDSNIVYYERIREAVREGRAVRSASESTFRDAFATIFWADMASLIGAGVLYQLTTGTVRGFALYLGLATLIDLVVSYLFMRPMVEAIARGLVRERPSRIGVKAETAVELGA